MIPVPNNTTLQIPSGQGMVEFVVKLPNGKSFKIFHWEEKPDRVLVIPESDVDVFTYNIVKREKEDGHAWLEGEKKQVGSAGKVSFIFK